MCITSGSIIKSLLVAASNDKCDMSVVTFNNHQGCLVISRSSQKAYSAVTVMTELGTCPSTFNLFYFLISYIRVLLAKLDDFQNDFCLHNQTELIILANHIGKS